MLRADVVGNSHVRRHARRAARAVAAHVERASLAPADEFRHGATDHRHLAVGAASPGSSASTTSPAEAPRPSARQRFAQDDPVVARAGIVGKELLPRTRSRHGMRGKRVLPGGDGLHGPAPPGRWRAVRTRRRALTRAPHGGDPAARRPRARRHRLGGRDPGRRGKRRPELVWRITSERSPNSRTSSGLVDRRGLGAWPVPIQGADDRGVLAHGGPRDRWLSRHAQARTLAVVVERGRSPPAPGCGSHGARRTAGHPRHRRRR